MTIHQKFTGDPSQLMKAYQDLAGANARLEQQVQKLAGTMGNTAREGQKGLGSIRSFAQQGMSDVKGLITQWVSLQGAIQLVSMELDDVAQKRERAMNAGVKTGSSQADIIRNLTGVTSETKAAFVKDTQAAFAASRFADLDEFNRAAASGLSASAGDREGTLNALRASAQLTRDKPQDLALLVGAALDIQKASGNKSAEENLGFLLQTGGQARQVDLRSQAVNIPSALISASNTVKGDRQQATREGAALFAALGSQAGDVRGESTRTAVQSFTVQLRDFFEKGVEKTVRGHKFHVKPGEDPGTIEGRIAALQKDDKLRAQFLDKASFERQFQVPVEQLLNRGATDKQFRSSLSQIRFGREEFDQQVRDLQGLTAATSLATSDAATKGRTQLNQVLSTHEGRAGQAAKIVADTLAETREHSSSPFLTKTAVDYLSQKAAGADDFFSGRNSIETSIETLEHRRANILRRGTLLGGKDWMASSRSVNELSPAERRDVSYVDDQLTILRQLLEEDKASSRAMEEQTQVLREVRDELKQRQPGGANAARAERGRHREQ